MPGRKVMNRRVGENAQTITISSLANAGPGYTDQADTAGGTNADVITFTNINNIATGAGGNVLNTEMTTCSSNAYDCGGANVGDTTAPFIKVLSNGSFTAFY